MLCYGLLLDTLLGHILVLGSQWLCTVALVHCCTASSFIWIFSRLVPWILIYYGPHSTNVLLCYYCCSCCSTKNNNRAWRGGVVATPPTISHQLSHINVKVILVMSTSTAWHSAGLQQCGLMGLWSGIRIKDRQAIHRLGGLRLRGGGKAMRKEEGNSEWCSSLVLSKVEPQPAWLKNTILATTIIIQLVIHHSFHQPVPIQLDVRLNY